MKSKNKGNNKKSINRPKQFKKQDNKENQNISNNKSTKKQKNNEIYFKKNEELKKKQEEEDKKSAQRKAEIEQENKFRFNLLKQNLVLHLIKRDGNCLFSSISDQVYGTENHSSIVREKCMDFIEKNKLFYSQFIEGGEAQMSAYIQRKRKNGIWGDNLEIQALSEIYNRPIEIYKDVNKTLSSLCNESFNKKYPIRISYIDKKHYNSIVPSTKHKDYKLFQNELLNNSKPGIYETKFIKEYDISKKFEQKNIIEKIQLDIPQKDDELEINENDFLYQDMIENDINDIDIKNLDLNDKMKNEESKNEDSKYQENKNKIEENKEDEEYLENPIIQKALDFGFDLKASIEALEVCGNEEELVFNYLLNNQNQ